MPLENAQIFLQKSMTYNQYQEVNTIIPLSTSHNEYYQKKSLHELKKTIDEWYSYSVII